MFSFVGGRKVLSRIFLYAVRVLGYVVGMEVSREVICIGQFKFRIDLFHSFGIAFIRPWYKVNGVSLLNFCLKSAKRKKLPVYI